LRVAFCDYHALLLHRRRQIGHRQLQFVLHLHLRDVGICARHKIKRDDRLARRLAD